MFLGRARMELPKDGTTWRWLFPWEGETCWNFVWEKAKVEEMLGQGGLCPRSTRSQGQQNSSATRGCASH